MKDLLFQFFDKLLLAALFLLVIHIELVLIWHGTSVEIVHEFGSLASGFQGAILGLITGVAVGKHIALASMQKDNKPEDGPPSASTT